MSKLRPHFWRDIPLAKMRKAEWEALCDGCGKCCVIKLEDEDHPGQAHYTDIACRLFDAQSCRCGAYKNRDLLVSDCVVLSVEELDEMAHWLPVTCAYRLLHAGRGLPDWHPLITGDPESVHRAGVSARGRVTPEYEVDEDDWEDHIMEWDK